MTLKHLHQVRFLALLALLSFVAIPATVVAQRPMEQVFLDAAKMHTDKLARLLQPVRLQEYKHRENVGLMLSHYDLIMTKGPGKERLTWATYYERERPVVVAEAANLDAAVRQLTPEITATVEFLLAFKEYQNLDAWEKLNKLAASAQLAVMNSRMIPRPPPLPDPLPETPIPPVERGDVSYANPDLKVGVANELQVEVKSNHHFTEANARVEVRVREGDARLHGSVFRTVTLKPQETKVLTWGFTPTKPGTVRIGARIVK